MEETPSRRSARDEPSFASLTKTPSEHDSDEPSLTSFARTPSGTSVGVDDPHAYVDRCDHCTDDGKCRFAFERFEADTAFARERRDDDYSCPVARQTVDGDSADWDDWADCPNFAATTDGAECRRCGLEERRMAHDDERALLEEHHLSYADGDEQARPAAGEADGTSGDDASADGAGGDPGDDVGTDDPSDDVSSDGDDAPAHEITVALCRWCHAKVHKSWARIDDDVSPDPEAIAAREQRRGQELEEASFQSAAERYGGEE